MYIRYIVYPVWRAPVLVRLVSWRCLSLRSLCSCSCICWSTFTYSRPVQCLPFSTRDVDYCQKKTSNSRKGSKRKQRSIAKNNAIGQAASCCVLMEEDFVTKLLRNSGNSAPDQQNRGASGNTSATGPYQNLRVPEVSGLWDSTIDLSRSHDATTTKTAQVCSLNCYL